MYSIGDLLDRLIIENIKIANIKQELNTIKKSDEGYVALYEKMMKINTNRGVVIDLLDKKIEAVKNGKPNKIFQTIKTYT